MLTWGKKGYKGICLKNRQKKRARKPSKDTLPLVAYLFITYIVTSKPKRISVAAGVVHMVCILCYPSNLPVNMRLTTYPGKHIKKIIKLPSLIRRSISHLFVHIHDCLRIECFRMSNHNRMNSPI